MAPSDFGSGLFGDDEPEAPAEPKEKKETEAKQPYRGRGTTEAPAAKERAAPAAEEAPEAEEVVEREPRGRRHRVRGRPRGREEEPTAEPEAEVERDEDEPDVEVEPQAEVEERRDSRRRRGRRRGRGRERDEERAGAHPTGETRSLPKRAAAAQRIAVLADLDSLEDAAERQFDGHLSPIGLLDQVGHGRQVPRALAYYAAEKRSRSEALRGAGFETLVAVENRCRRLVQLTVDAIAVARRVDAIVVATADPSLYPLIEYLRNQGLKIEVATFADTARDFEDALERGAGCTALGEESVFVP